MQSPSHFLEISRHPHQPPELQSDISRDRQSIVYKHILSNILETNYFQFIITSNILGHVALWRCTFLFPPTIFLLIKFYQEKILIVDIFKNILKVEQKSSIQIPISLRILTSGYSDYIYIQNIHFLPHQNTIHQKFPPTIAQPMGQNRGLALPHDPMLLVTTDRSGGEFLIGQKSVSFSSHLSQKSELRSGKADNDNGNCYLYLCVV